LVRFENSFKALRTAVLPSWAFSLLLVLRMR